nr:cytochrome b6-f complex subunit VIII [Geodorum eulophioides]QVH34352.1 cytochrome b6-f complex subunit VIII [Geodorum eulophioides]
MQFAMINRFYIVIINILNSIIKMQFIPLN